MRSTIKATIVDASIQHCTIGRDSYEKKQCPRSKGIFKAIDAKTNQILEFPYWGIKGEKLQRRRMKELLSNGQILRLQNVA